MKSAKILASILLIALSYDSLCRLTKVKLEGLIGAILVFSELRTTFDEYEPNRKLLLR